MNIPNQNNSLQFTARNPEIRKADKIMRQAMNLYPATSSSKAHYYNVVKKDSYNERKCLGLYYKLCDLRKNKKNLKPIQVIKQTIKDTAETHNGNCLEMAQIMQAAFLANGYKDIKIGKLRIKEQITRPDKTKKKKEHIVDHVLLIVNAGKKARLNNPKSFDKHAMIVDPWRGFVDYVHNGLTRYDGLFMNGFRDENTFWGKFKQRFFFKRYDRLNPTDKTCEKFAKSNPEFILKEK